MEEHFQLGQVGYSGQQSAISMLWGLSISVQQTFPRYSQELSRRLLLIVRFMSEFQIPCWISPKCGKRIQRTKYLNPSACCHVKTKKLPSNIEWPCSSGLLLWLGWCSCPTGRFVWHPSGWFVCACDIAIVDNESNLYLQVSCFKQYLLDPIGHESWSL